MKNIKSIVSEKLLAWSLIIFVICVFLNSNVKAQSKKQHPNVLFIVIDDFRPEIGCYGNKSIITPNMDKLAKEGILFNRAYCQIPVCGASRASLLTGLRPNRDKFLDFEAWAEKDAPGITTLPKHFKDNGYTTISNGKVFHHLTDSKDAWSEPAWATDGHWRDYQTKENILLGMQDKKKFIANAVEAGNVDDYTYIDGKVAKKSIEDLKRLKDAGNPFFLAVGFRKPHLPFNAPKKYWDMYDPAKINLASNPYIPNNAPLESIHNSFELRVYKDVADSGLIDDATSRRLKHGYYACVTYVDALVGELTNELKKLGLFENTVIVLLGDNGYQLGEHTMWCKHCNYETSLNVPLIVRAPGMKNGTVTNALTEYVDLYPTLCGLAGLALPGHLEGDSFIPVLSGEKEKIKNEIFSRFQNGESVRNERYLYTEYFDKDGKMTGKMLYDHQVDPDENKNIALEKQNAKTVKMLSNLLKEHRAKYYR